MPRPEGKVTKLTIDLTGVEDRRGGGSVHVEEGDYLLKVRDVEIKDTKGKPHKHVSWQLAIEDGPEKKPGVIYHNTTLNPEQLWGFRNFLSDLLGKDIPKKALNLDLAKYKGLLIGASLSDDEPYNNKIKSKIDFTYPASEYKSLTNAPATGDDDEEEAEVQTADLSSDEDEEEEELETVDEDDI